MTLRCEKEIKKKNQEKKEVNSKETFRVSGAISKRNIYYPRGSSRVHSVTSINANPRILAQIRRAICS
jgi:hypothetical protein